MTLVTLKGLQVPDSPSDCSGADIQTVGGATVPALITLAVPLVLTRNPTAADDGANTGGAGPVGQSSFCINTATTPPTIWQCVSAATGAAVWQQVFPALASANALQQATVVATSALPSNTYANGSSGVGATLTANSLGALTIDGHAVALNDVVLVTDEAAPANNGVYVCTTAGASGAYYVLTRVTWMDLAAQFVGAIVPVGPDGTANANTLWQCQATSAPTIGTTAIAFAQISPPSGGYTTEVIVDDTGAATFTNSNANEFVLLEGYDSGDVTLPTCPVTPGAVANLRIKAGSTSSGSFSIYDPGAGLIDAINAIGYACVFLISDGAQWYSCGHVENT